MAEIRRSRTEEKVYYPTNTTFKKEKYLKIRIMSKALKKLEWLVIIYDKPINQRLKFRPQHFQNFPKLLESGNVTSAGPVFKDDERTQFAGSAFTIAAEKKSDVIDLLKKDVYAKEDVWDFDNVIIHPYTPVVRTLKEFPQ